jgi:DNA-binding NarL/FixJ family response regulator
VSGHHARDPGPIHVLIAEDDPNVREALTAMIESTPGLELTGAVEDAQQAVALAAAELPNVAIVDIRMPGGGGVWATREIMSASPRTSVIAFSGDSDRRTMAAMVEAGAVGYLVKGSSIGSIVETVQQAASTPRPG